MNLHFFRIGFIKRNLDNFDLDGFDLLNIIIQFSNFIGYLMLKKTNLHSIPSLQYSNDYLCTKQLQKMF